jgi:PadR family transcriptional regulator
MPCVLRLDIVTLARETHVGCLPDQKHAPGSPLLQGTVDLLILRTLLFGSQHGQGIARAIQEQSGDVLLVDHGSLYPALQRLEGRRWIRAEGGTSDNNRKARFYELTKTGRRQLIAETDQWRRLATAIGRILGPNEA